MLPALQADTRPPGPLAWPLTLGGGAPRCHPPEPTRSLTGRHGRSPHNRRVPAREGRKERGRQGAPRRQAGSAGRAMAAVNSHRAHPPAAELCACTRHFSPWPCPQPVNPARPGQRSPRQPPFPGLCASTTCLLLQLGCQVSTADADQCLQLAAAGGGGGGTCRRAGPGAVWCCGTRLQAHAPPDHLRPADCCINLYLYLY